MTVGLFFYFKNLKDAIISIRKATKDSTAPNAIIAKALDKSINVKEVIRPRGLVFPVMHLSTLGVYFFNQ